MLITAFDLSELTAEIPLSESYISKISSPIFHQIESKIQKCIFYLAFSIEKCKTQRIFSIEKCNIGSKHNMVLAKSFFFKNTVFFKNTFANCKIL